MKKTKKESQTERRLREIEAKLQEHHEALRVHNDRINIFRKVINRSHRHLKAFLNMLCVVIGAAALLGAWFMLPWKGMDECIGSDCQSAIEFMHAGITLIIGLIALLGSYMIFEPSKIIDTTEAGP